MQMYECLSLKKKSIKISVQYSSMELKAQTVLLTKVNIKVEKKRGKKHAMQTALKKIRLAMKF